MTYLRANSNLDHKNPILGLKAYNNLKEKQEQKHAEFPIWKQRSWLVSFERRQYGLTILPDQTSQSKGNKLWIFIGKTDTEAGAPLLWSPDAKSWLTGKDPYAGKDLKAGEGNDRGWVGWMASPTWWTWVWETFGSWWWTGKPDMLQSMWSQSQTRLSNWNELNDSTHIFNIIRNEIIAGYALWHTILM